MSRLVAIDAALRFVAVAVAFRLVAVDLRVDRLSRAKSVRSRHSSTAADLAPRYERSVSLR